MSVKFTILNYKHNLYKNVLFLSREIVLKYTIFLILLIFLKKSLYNYLIRKQILEDFFETNFTF